MKFLVSLPLYLTIVFVALRLFGIIAWSWWWVVSPMWIAGASLYLLLFIVVAAIKSDTVSKKYPHEDLLDIH